MQTDPSLKVHEWLAVVIIIAIFTLIASYACFSPKTQHHFIANRNEIEVVVKGAVAAPGVYKVKSGTILSEVLALAKPTPEANLSRVKSESKVRKGQVIHVPTHAKKKKREKMVVRK